MPTRTLSAALLAIALLAGSPAKADEALTVEQIVAKSIEARGGRDAWLAIESAKLSGTTAIGGGPTGTFALWVKRPSKMRFEVEMSGTSLTQAYDGVNGWAILPTSTGRPRPQPLEEDQLQQLRDMADFDGPLLDFKAKGNKVELVGPSDVEGAPAYELEITKPSGQVSRTFLDATSFLPLLDVITVERPEGDLVVDVDYSDYKAVSGVLLAHTLVQSVAGTEASQTISIQAVEPNVDVPDSMFEMPSAAPAQPPG